MPYLKIRVPKKGIKPYFPLGDKDFNVSLYRVKPREIIAWHWNSVLKFAWIKICFLSGSLSLCLTLSLFHLFTLLLFVLNLLAPSLPVVILDVISHPGYQSKSLPNFLPLSSDSLSNIQTVIQKNSSVCKKVSKMVIQALLLTLSAFHIDPLNISYVLLFMWSHF